MAEKHRGRNTKEIPEQNCSHHMLAYGTYLKVEVRPDPVNPRRLGESLKTQKAKSS